MSPTIGCSKPVSTNSTTADLDDPAQRIALAVDAAIETLLDPLEFGPKLAQIQDDDAGHLPALRTAFLYTTPHGRRSPQRHYFRPWIETSAGSSPAPLTEIPNQLRAVWDRYAALLASPAARARLHDLCFETRHGDVQVHARAAVDAYLEVAGLASTKQGGEDTGPGRQLVAVHALQRALDLSRRSNQADLGDRVIERLVGFAKEALDDAASPPGVVLGYLDMLAGDRSEIRELVELLASARSRYQNDVWYTGSVIDLQLRRASDEGMRATLRRDLVESRFAASDREVTPMNAFLHLKDAAELAQKWGFSDLADRAISRLQQNSIEDLGLKARRTSVSLPKEMVDGFLDQFTKRSSWQEAIDVLLLVDPPSGNVEQNRIQASQMPDIAPLSTSLPRLRLGPDGMPRLASSGNDPEVLLADVEAQRLQILGPVHVEALRRIGEKWSPSEEELTSFFAESRHVPERLAAALARGVSRFFAEDYEAAVYMCTPKVERLARELLLAGRVAVFRVPVGDRAGQYPGLGAMLGTLLERGVDESWIRFIDTLLSRQEGLNFRNELCHGSVDDPAFVVAGLVIVAAIYLAHGVGFADEADGAQPI